MRAVVQRVRAARVFVEESELAAVGPVLCVLLGVARNDEGAAAERLAARVARLRIFANEEGKFDQSVADVGGSVLVVSQFTLIADTRKGNRPSFTEAAPPDRAEPVYEAFCAALGAQGVDVAVGRFGASMVVEIENDGPVTLVLDA